MPENGLGRRFKNAWNAFLSREPTRTQNFGAYYYGGYRSDRFRLSRGNERSIVNSIYTRIATDAASVNINHVQLDKDTGQFTGVLDTGLNRALNDMANIDQTGRELIFDAVLSMLGEGCVAIVPVDTTKDPRITDSYDILSLRTGRITKWYPKEVQVEVYNEEIGKKQEVVLPKHTIAIVENPFYTVMNEPNSTLQRLIRKLNILDVVDEQSGSGKLDLIIQLPYSIRSEAKRLEAENRRKEIERQLTDTKYGIAYADATEHITQLNRSVENNLLKTIEYLTSMLYGQLGISEEILKGTADEQKMLNYHNQTIEPIVSALVNAMRCKFLSTTARTQGKSIQFFRDPFKLVPAKELADISDRFTRNEILSSNEFRAIIGRKPVDSPRADELRNKNINQGDEQQTDFGSTRNTQEEIQNGSEI